MLGDFEGVLQLVADQREHALPVRVIQTRRQHDAQVSTLTGVGDERQEAAVEMSECADAILHVHNRVGGIGSRGASRL